MFARALPFLLLLVSCSAPPPEQVHKTPNRWADERLWPVLEAQEHRNTDALCALLLDTSVVVREASALAFASVQDTSGIPCLLNALNDTAAVVRSAAVFALGQVADTVTVERMEQVARNEPDSAVRQAYIGACFLARQRKGALLPSDVLDLLQHGTPHDRVRAADALRRMEDSLVRGMAEQVRALLQDADTDVRSFALLALRKLGEGADRSTLNTFAAADHDPRERVNALRVLAAGSANDSVDPLVPFLADPQPVVRTAAVEALVARPCSEAITRIDRAAVDRNDPRSWIPVYGLLEHCTLRDGEVIIRPPVPADAGPYVRAALIDVATKDPQQIPVDSMVALFRRDVHPVLRQAGLQGAIRHARDLMARSRYATREAQYAQLGQVLRAAIATGDAGLISAAAEELAKEEPDAIRVMLDPATERQALEVLAPIRDLEARLLLQQVVAKRDGSAPPANQRPAFNHPIAKDRLRALEQGQQYRIVTTQGEVIIATDVNGCPGTSLAFDSLVAAGYYNGRSFHRMVPNFVVQGGCPRGDGYGGMDWTLRTEIGRRPFTAGSVGLASAGPDTESCQFFITHSATPHLDGRYTRFGEVVSGMDVVWKLRVGDVMERVERIQRP